MVDIKGLEKARVLKALCERSEYLDERMMQMDLSGDEFDERGYDSAFGAGAAQRAVDSVWAEQENGGDANGGAGASEGKDAGSESSEKKELSMDEKVKLTKDAIGKIIDILGELPPDVTFAVGTMLKATVPGLDTLGGMAGMLMMGGPFAQPMGGLPGMKTSVHIADELDRASFPFKGRFG